MESQRSVHVVSHGPGCLDGLVAAVVVARAGRGHDFDAVFAAPRDVDEVLRGFRPPRASEAELWITDISWRDAATDRHLQTLLDGGALVYWMDHHKSALDRVEAHGLAVRPSEYVLDVDRSAARIVWDWLAAHAEAGSAQARELAELHPLVVLADDIDRWVLAVPGSREIALAVSAMDQEEAFDALMAVDARLDWPVPLRRAARRVRAEISESLALASATCTTRQEPARDLTVVAAECEGYAGEVADRWKARFPRAVFALLDRRADAVSLRRGDKCPVDLSRLASSFGGGGHAAAAGFDPDEAVRDARDVAETVAGGLARGADL